MLSRFQPALAVVCCCAFTAISLAEVPETLLSSPLAQTWGRAPTIDRPRLSPDGSKLLYLAQDASGVTQALVLDLASKDLTSIVAGTEDEYDIGWCEWASESRVLCDMVLAVNADGSEFLQLDRERMRHPPERIAACGIPLRVGAVEVTMDWMPEDSAHIARACGGIPQQFDLLTGAIEELPVGFGRDLRGALMSDGHNFTRLQRHRDTLSGYDRWYFRESAEADWILLQDTNPREFSEPLRPAGFGEDLSVIYHLAPVGGIWGLHTLVPAQEPLDQDLFTHPSFDIELIDTMGAYDRVVAAAYLDERPQRFVVDDRVRGVYRAASDRFPLHNIEVLDESWDSSKYLLLVRPPQRAGDYYLFDRNDESFLPIGPMYEHLSDVELAATQSVRFPASDGGTIAGHLTVPAGATGALPAVIIPRARPTRLDLEDPHYLVQFLAASGYAVLRLNNRGPEEYDDAWLPERTALAWERSAADIDAAMHYLIEQGVAADGRVCTLGRDVGAYAAFMNAIEYPGVMDCVIGIGASATIPEAEWVTVLAGDFTPLQKDSSPTRRNKDWDASVLLFHGQYDEIVPMLPNSAKLAQSLDRKDFDVSFIEYENARHDIKRGPHRIDMLTRIGAFLDRRIGDQVGGLGGAVR